VVDVDKDWAFWRAIGDENGSGCFDINLVKLMVTFDMLNIFGFIDVHSTAGTVNRRCRHGFYRCFLSRFNPFPIGSCLPSVSMRCIPVQYMRTTFQKRIFPRMKVGSQPGFLTMAIAPPVSTMLERGFSHNGCMKTDLINANNCLIS